MRSIAHHSKSSRGQNDNSYMGARCESMHWPIVKRKNFQICWWNLDPF